MPVRFHGKSSAGALYRALTSHFVNEMLHAEGSIFEKMYVVLPKIFDFAIR